MCKLTRNKECARRVFSRYTKLHEKMPCKNEIGLSKVHWRQTCCSTETECAFSQLFEWRNYRNSKCVWVHQEALIRPFSKQSIDLNGETFTEHEPITRKLSANFCLISFDVGIVVVVCFFVMIIKLMWM